MIYLWIAVAFLILPTWLGAVVVLGLVSYIGWLWFVNIVRNLGRRNA